MELVVTDRATGQSYRWHSQRLITLPDTDGRGERKVALLAPYPHGWVIYPIVPARRGPRVNRLPVTAPRVIEPGLEFRVGATKFLVDRADGSGLPPPPIPAADRCEILVRVRGAVIASREADRLILVGSSEHCNFRLPADIGLTPEHLLVAHVHGRWFAHDLSGKLIRRLGEPPTRMLGLESGDSIWSNEVEVLVRYAAWDPLDSRIAGDPGPLGEGHPGPHAGSVVETPSKTPAETARGARAGEAPDPLYTLAHELCAWIQEALKQPADPNPPAASDDMADPRSWSGNPEADLDRFRTALAMNPHDEERLLQLADYLRQLRFDPLRRWLLKHANSYLPGRPRILRAIAEATAALANDPAAATDRAAHLASAHKYASWAVVADPNDMYSQDLQRRLARELRHATEGNDGLAVPGEA